MCLWAVLLALSAAGPVEDDPRDRLRAHEALSEGRPHLGVRFRELSGARREQARAGRSSALRVQGDSWVNVGPATQVYGVNGIRYTRVDSGRGRNVLVHPTDPDVLLLATAGGGVWRTLDGGQHWDPITDTLGTLSVGALAMDPASPEVLYLGLGDPFDRAQPGLTVSRDGGASWSDPVLLQGTLSIGGTSRDFLAGSVRDVTVDPRASNHVLAGTDIGLFESNDAGGTFHLVDLPGGAAAIWSMAWAGGGTLLVTGQLFGAIDDVQGAQRNGSDSSAPLGFWRTEDAGRTWSSALPGLPAGEAASIARATVAAAASTIGDPAGARLFLLAAQRVDDGDTSQRDVYRSDDGGRTWDPLGVNAAGKPVNPTAAQPTLDALGGQAWYNQALAVDPLDANIVYLGGAETSLRSTDGGLTWSVMTEGYAVFNPEGLALVHPDFHGFAIGAFPDAASPPFLRRTLYASNDGGLYRSRDAHAAADGKVTFSDALNNGLVTHLVYEMACADPSWPASLQGFVIGGTQDNGIRRRTGATTTFDEVSGGDGIGVAVSRAVLQNVGDPVPALVFGSSARHVYASIDGGLNWGRFENGLTSIPFLVRFARDADGASFLTYTERPDLGVYVTKGQSWTRVGGGFVTGEGQPSALHGIAAHPTRSGVWGAVGDAGSVYFTHDSGQTWTRAPAVLGMNEQRTQGLKGTTSIAFPPDYDPANPASQTLYASSLATTLYDAQTPIPDGFGHAFKTTDGGSSWQPLLGSGSRKLPDVAVERVRVDPGDPQTLYVATQIGLYRSTDGGATFDRFGHGLPLVRVSDVCISGNSIYAATYGRGFWQLDTSPFGNPAGVRGDGDTNHDRRIDGLDLADLAAALGSTQADASYRGEADLVGITNRVDDADLAALLQRFGGSP